LEGTLLPLPSCANQLNLERNGEPSHLDDNGALDASVKEKLVNSFSYQHDYSERNIFFLPAVMMESTEPKQVYSGKLGFVSERTIKDIIIITTSGRISGDFIRLTVPETNAH
jgi:hypothetical protein